MDKPARNKPAVLKISRKSATRIGPLQTQGPFPRAKKPLLSGRTSTINASESESAGRVWKEAMNITSQNRTPTTPVPVQIQGPPNDNAPVSWDQASTSPKPVQTPRRKTSVPAFSDRPSAPRDLYRTQEPLPKTGEPLSSTRGPVPKTRIPVPSGYGNQGSASKKPGPLQTQGSAFSERVMTKPGLVQTPGPLSKGDEPAFLDQTSTSPRSVGSGCRKSLPISSDRPSTSPGPLQTRGSIPKTKIPILSESRIQGTTSTSPGPVQTLGPKTYKPIVTGRAFGSTFSVQAQGTKASEPLSSVRRNRGSASRYPGLVSSHGAVLSARTPTSPDILQNRRPCPKASESVSFVVRNRGSVSTSPSYIRRPKISVPVHPDQTSAGPNRLQTRGPKARKPVSSVSKSAFRSPGPLQSRGLLPKTNKLKSPVIKNRGSASTHFGSVSIGMESPKHVSSRAPASPVPAKTPGLKAKESVTSASKNKDFAFRRPAILRTNKRRIPVTPDGMQNLNTEPEFPLKQSLKSSPSTSPDRKSQLAKLADELDRRNRSISELEIKLVQNQNLVSEQALRLAESEAVQRAKDVALEQLKSELLTAKNEYDRMHLRLRESDLGLEQATSKVNKYLERITSMENELKEARDKIVNLQRQLKDADTKVEIHCQAKDQLRQDAERMQVQLVLDSKKIQSLQQIQRDLKGDLENKDRIVTQINHELATKEEEFRNLFQTLKNKHILLRSQQLTLKQMEELNQKSSLKHSKLEVGNAALQENIEQLKKDLRHYSQIIIANDGKPFFEKVPPETQGKRA